MAIRTDITNRKITETELMKSKEQALSSNLAKNEFLATMRHEIRTPLNGLMGMMNLLKDTSLSDTQHDFIGTMESSGSILLNIINDILDYSKIDAGKMDVESIPFSLGEAIKDVSEILGPLAKSKSVSLSFQNTLHNAADIKGDPGRIRQVLMNILSNAIKFTEKGSVLATLEKDGLFQTVKIKDTGIGIAPEKHSLLFKKFSQMDASNTRKYGGTGLGLAISKRLVELMHGTLGFESELGAGSTFWFRMPKSLDANGNPIVNPIVDQKDSEGGEKNSTWTPLSDSESKQAREINSLQYRALVVEDNVVNQKVAEGMLKKKGRIVDVAANGIEGVKMFKQFPYDIIFMDCQMPEMDGFEATRIIRNLESLHASMSKEEDIDWVKNHPKARIIIVALTAGAMAGDRDNCIESGMDDFVSKPVRPAELKRVLTLLETVKQP